MKRFLSWLVLIGCYLVFCIAVHIDIFLSAYAVYLYSQLSSFLKLLIIIIGGPCCLCISGAPLLFGVIWTHQASEYVCPSQLGVRYIIMGILIILCCILEAIVDLRLRDILIAVYGIALIVIGNNHSIIEQVLYTEAMYVSTKF